MLEHSGEPASRLIWIYAIAMGAFQGVTAVLALFLADRFQVTEQTIGYFFMYIGSISVFTRVLLLGKAVDRLGEARLSRIGMVLLAIGLGAMPLARSLPVLALAVAFIPLGTAFTFPCVTALLVARDLVARSAGCTWACSRRSAASRASSRRCGRASRTITSARACRSSRRRRSCLRRCCWAGPGAVSFSLQSRPNDVHGPTASSCPVRR